MKVDLERICLGSGDAVSMGKINIMNNNPLVFSILLKEREANPRKGIESGKYYFILPFSDQIAAAGFQKTLILLVFTFFFAFARS